MNNWFSSHMCVFWGTQTSWCVFWTSRDFMMRWVNCIKVRLVCLNSVVVSGYCCLKLVMLLHGCLHVGELMEAQEDIQVTSDSPLVSWRQLFKLFQVSEDLTVEIIFQSTVNSNPCLIVAEKNYLQRKLPVLFLSSERIFTYCFTSTSCSSLLQQVKTEVAISVPLALSLESK